MPENLKRWIREEHEIVHDLMQAVRAKVAVAPRINLAPWIEGVQDRFEHLRAHLTKHMALEEQDGFLDAIVERRPALSSRVEQLVHEHRELAKIMDGVHRSLAELRPEDRLILRDCCHRIDVLLGFLERHEELENDLVSIVFTQDIGTKD